MERKKVVYEEWKDAPVKATCDICGEELIPTEKSEDERTVDLYDFFMISTHHHDWSNDSCESYSYFVACSPECAKKHFEDYWKKHFKQHDTHEWEIRRLDRLDWAKNCFE